MTTTVGPKATAEDILAAVGNIAPILREDAAQGENDGELTAEVVNALHDAGIFGIWVPTELGGSELDPMSSLKVIQQLTESDAAAAWVSMAAALAIGTGGAYLSDEAVNELFGGERFPVIAGQGTRPGRATTESDGFRLSGEWNFASGVKHSQWIHTLGIIEETGEARIFILPVEQAKLDQDSWDVMGLKATGSLDYSIQDALVRDNFTYLGPTETPLRGGAVFTMGTMHFSLLGHTGWALGVARRMLDEIKSLVHAKAGRPGTLAENPRFHAEYAEAEAKYYAARGFAYQIWENATETIYAGQKLSVDQKTLIRLALYHATWSAEAISNFVHRLAGTKSIWPSDIQRYYRDMHTGTQHITSSFPVPENCGKLLAGLAPGHDWLYMNVVPQESMPEV